jgi:hypothetical protein
VRRSSAPFKSTVQEQPKGPALSTHIANRPAWTCIGCGHPWPCTSRRRELLAEYRGPSVSLNLYLASCYLEAASDLRGLPTGELYQRFLGWVHGGPP